MSRSQFGILVAVAVVSGFLGGGASYLLLRGTPAAAQTGTVQAQTPGAVQDEVKAKSFRLVDDAGKTRAWLNCFTDSPATLGFYDAAGKPRATLGYNRNGEPCVVLADEDGMARTSWFVVAGETKLIMGDAEGRTRVLMGYTTEGPDKVTGAETTHPESTLILFGPKSDVLWRAP